MVMILTIVLPSLIGVVGVFVYHYTIRPYFRKRFFKRVFYKGLRSIGKDDKQAKRISDLLTERVLKGA